VIRKREKKVRLALIRRRGRGGKKVALPVPYHSGKKERKGGGKRRFQGKGGRGGERGR